MVFLGDCVYKNHAEKKYYIMPWTVAEFIAVPPHCSMYLSNQFIHEYNNIFVTILNKLSHFSKIIGQTWLVTL